jgi:hypothetical protein
MNPSARQFMEDPRAAHPDAASVTVLALALLLSPLGWLLRAAEPSPNAVQPTVILVTGAPGEAEFGSNFVCQAQAWTRVCDQAGVRLVRIGADTATEPTDRDRLKQALAAEPVEAPAALWLVFSGHGTFDGKEARFNLRGPDLTASELAAWLAPFRRPLVVIDTASASAPFLARLSATNRVIITATRSGHEQNFARFGGYFAEALASPAADLDQDGQTSLLEAFLAAARHVAEFYQTEGRLATEHALLDDNGDRLGTPADWFRGLRASKKPEGGASLDGARAHQLHLVLSRAELALSPSVRAQRDALELEVFRLRETKSTLPEADYYQRLETILLQLARLQVTNHVCP